nr:MAG TPA: hypothetical protein [Caudoviricetes sp.]
MYYTHLIPLSAIRAFTCACMLSISLIVYYTHLAHVGKLRVPYSACISTSVLTYT